MERLTFLLLLLLCVGLAGSSAVDLHKRIVHGHICHQGECPHHVKVTGQDAQGNSYVCGGSLITNQSILTAAHCYKPTMHAVLGLNPVPNSNLQPTGEILVQQIPHPSGDDIMLLELPTPYNYPIIGPPAGPLGCTKPAPGQTVRVSGHGQYQLDQNNYMTGPPSHRLQCVEMNVINCTFAPCETPLLRGMTHDKFFCGQMMDINRNVMCTGSGDSGGGVVYNNTLHGIVKGAPPCVNSQTCTAKFVDVCQYIDWINRNIQGIWN